jgi:hypothetical protein
VAEVVLVAALINRIHSVHSLLINSNRSNSRLKLSKVSVALVSIAAVAVVEDLAEVVIRTSRPAMHLKGKVRLVLEEGAADSMFKLASLSLKGASGQERTVVRLETRPGPVAGRE